MRRAQGYCAFQRETALFRAPRYLLNHAKPIERRGVLGLMGKDSLEMHSGCTRLAAALQGLRKTNARIGVLGEFFEDIGV